MFKQLADNLQDAEFGTEYTLDLNTGMVEKSDTLGIDELVYASYTGKSWQLDYSHAILPELSTITDTLYEPANYLNECALMHHLPEMDEIMTHSKLVATLAIVDTYDCEDCESGDNDEPECMFEHDLGWAIITALIV